MILLTSKDLVRILNSEGTIKIRELNLREIEVDCEKIKPLIKKSYLKDDESIFIFDGEELRKLGFYRNGFYYKLVPTDDAPTLEISGVKMHRIVNITPWEDARRKVCILNIKGGKVLDICTGLGYTAIWASKFADEVITVEKDNNVIEIAKINPWSKELFENPKIKLIIGDATEVIKDFEDNSFDYLIHDPPRFDRAPELYSLEFYKELFRVLKGRGRGYIYTTRDRRYLKGILNRIRKAGFMVKFLGGLDGAFVTKP